MRRPRNPTPPRQPTDSPLLLLLLLLIQQVQGCKPCKPHPSQYSVRSGAPFGGGLYWYSQVSVSVLPPLRRYRRMSIWSVESSGGTRSNMAR